MIATAAAPALAPVERQMPWLRHLALPAILLVAAVLRFIWLWIDAPPLFADEIEQYVSVHSIVTTGTDVDRALHPFLYCRLGRNPPVYGIAGYASTLVFGNTSLGWRLPAALFGLIAVWLVYLIVRRITGRQAIAALAAFFFAIEPNSIHFSRIGWEPATVLPCVLSAIYVALTAIRNDGRSLSFPLLLAGAVALGLCPYTYPLTSLYASLLVGSLLVLHRRALGNSGARRKLLAAGAVAAAIALPGLWFAATDPHTVERSLRVFTFAGGVSGESLRIFAGNYARHFGWPYLFATGSRDARYLNGYGVLYWWYAPLLAFGLVYGRRYIRSRATYLWLLFWLAVYPLGGSLANDGIVPHAPRTLAGMPVFSIIAAIGAYALLVEVGRCFPNRVRRLRFRRCAVVAIAASALLSAWSFSSYYFTVYPRVSARAWESGAREAFAAVSRRQTGYRRLCVAGFNYWHIETLERYFLSPTPLKLIEGTQRAECRQPATMLLTTAYLPVRGFFVVNVSSGADGNVFAVLQARGPAPTTHEPGTAHVSN